jgi:hypothetical protein
MSKWCHVTFDRELLQHSDVVVFSGLRGDGFTCNTQLPQRNVEQPWAIYLVESPAYYGLCMFVYLYL